MHTLTNMGRTYMLHTNTYKGTAHLCTHRQPQAQQSPMTLIHHPFIHASYQDHVTPHRGGGYGRRSEVTTTITCPAESRVTITNTQQFALGPHCATLDSSEGRMPSPLFSQKVEQTEATPSKIPAPSLCHCTSVPLSANADTDTSREQATDTPLSVIPSTSQSCQSRSWGGRDGDGGRTGQAPLLDYIPHQPLRRTL